MPVGVSRPSRHSFLGWGKQYLTTVRKAIRSVLWCLLVRRRKPDATLRGNHRNLLYVGVHELRKLTANFVHEVLT